ncbi:DNA repair protein XRCC1 [Trichinella pseudospiralis]|uniref:DNA repair protein XRCC1 n=2 Tax=Trichinella pseudospiralis TaxID=6337 RepID=A0A0V0XN92_TRIPS|nr:DNA repair protein XRCC1 [Trichinella pseudospiralis]KRZ40010.1 DNA repair protein XRCC1 [Trichinella pseudospiralis]
MVLKNVFSFLCGVYTGAYIVQNYDVPVLPHPNELYEKVKLWLESADKAFVVIQLEQLEQIDAIDIRNQNSAYIEIHVARSDDDFRVLLPITEFMTPEESKKRRYRHQNRLKFFTKKDFIPSAAEQCWDRVKIICYQPFRFKAYGISFICLKRLVNVDDALLDNDMCTGEFRDRFSVEQLPSPIADDRDGPGCYQKQELSDDWASDISIKGPVQERRSLDILFDIKIVFIGFNEEEEENLIGKGKRLGATIMSHWEDSVTHVIFNPASAFPEIQLYIGQSYIVKPEWLEDCFAYKRHFCILNYLHDLEKLEQQHLQAVKLAEMKEFQELEKLEQICTDHENGDGAESTCSWDSIYEKDTESGSDSGESINMAYQFFSIKDRDRLLRKKRKFLKRAIEGAEEVEFSPGFVTEYEEKERRAICSFNHND